MSINTIFLLMAQYGGKAVVPLEDVQRDFFSHLSLMKLIRKIDLGEIRLPMIRIERSQKSARHIHLSDLAAYLDLQRAEAIRVHGEVGKIRL